MLTLISVVMFFLLARAFRSPVLAGRPWCSTSCHSGRHTASWSCSGSTGTAPTFVYGVPAIGSIRDFIPILVFAFLFGLSMDYEVFVLARMREEYDRSGSTHDAIVGGPCADWTARDLGRAHPRGVVPVAEHEPRPPGARHRNRARVRHSVRRVRGANVARTRIGRALRPGELVDAEPSRAAAPDQAASSSSRPRLTRKAPIAPASVATTVIA